VKNQTVVRALLPVPTELLSSMRGFRNRTSSSSQLRNWKSLALSAISPVICQLLKSPCLWIT